MSSITLALSKGRIFEETLPLLAAAGIVPTDTGVILSTGNVTDFTNSSGTTDTNTQAGFTTNPLGGIDGDAQLNAVAGMATFDGAILNASFIPTGDMLTMQFVFSSEEYPEYVNGGVNDAFGVWINGNFVPATISVAGNISIKNLFLGGIAGKAGSPPPRPGPRGRRSGSCRAWVCAPCTPAGSRCRWR